MVATALPADHGPRLAGYLLDGGPVGKGEVLHSVEAAELVHAVTFPPEPQEEHGPLAEVAVDNVPHVTQVSVQAGAVINDVDVRPESIDKLAVPERGRVGPVAHAHRVRREAALVGRCEHRPHPGSS